MTELQQRPGRPCTVCGHAERDSIELALTEGSTFRAVADAYPPLTRNAVRRHTVGGHIRSDLAAEAYAVAGLSHVALVERVHDVARSAREAREESMQRGHHATALRAGDAELRALSVLAQLGVKHEGEIEDATAQRLTLTALRRAIREHPELGDSVAREFDALDLGIVADAVRGFVSRNKELQQ